MEFADLLQQESDLADTTANTSVNIVGSNVGRKKTKIWEHFKSLNHARAECIHCKKSVRARPGTSMKNHLSTCVIARSLNIDLSLLNPELIEKKTATKSKKENQKISISDFDPKRANYLLSKFLFTSGAPISILNNSDFKDFLTYLNKSYKPFNKKIFMESILGENLEAYENHMKKILQTTKFITLNIDCWSTSGKKGSLYGIVISLPDGEEFLLDILEMGSESSAADNVLNKLDDIINNLSPKKVFAIVSDSGSRNVSSLTDKIIQKFPNIFQLSSFVHTLNLLCNNLLKNQYIDKTLKDASYLLDSFSKSSRLKSKFKDAQLEISDDVSITPLASAKFLRAYYCLATLSEYESTMISSNSETTLRERQKELAEDDLFWKDIRDLVRMLEPLYTVIKLADSAILTPSDVFFYLTKISLNLSFSLKDKSSHCGSYLENDLYKPLYIIILKYLNDPIFQLCTILDCRYQVEFSNKTLSKIKKFLKSHLEKRGASRPLIERCISNFELFTLNRKQNKNHPSVFWEHNFEYSTLSPFAFSLFNIVANSMSCERTFSNLGYINSLRRSRVTKKNLVSFTKIHNNIIRQNKEKETSKFKNEELLDLVEMLDYNVLQKVTEISDPFSDSIPTEMVDLVKNIIVIFASNEAVRSFTKTDERGKPLSIDDADQEMLGLMF